MAPSLSRSLGASSVAALRPCAGRVRAPGAGAARGSGSARCGRGVRWEAGSGSRGRLVRVRCDAAVAEKAEETAEEEKFEYQAEVSDDGSGWLRGWMEIVSSLFDYASISLELQ
jgi:heat shock protein beta